MKYKAEPCRCGRIHIKQKDDNNWLAEDTYRRVIHICGNCGYAYKSFLTENMEDGYDCNCYGLNEGVSFEYNSIKIYYSRGIKVYMKSGAEADSYQNGYFANCEEWQFAEKDPNYKSIIDSERKRESWAVVDVEKLINDVERTYKDEADDILKAISSFFSLNIHWSGTKYEQDWNK